MKSVTLLLAVALSSTQAYGACTSETDVLADCFDNFKEAASDTFQSDDEGERAQTAREAIQRCRDCAYESFNDSLDKLSGK